MARFNYFQAEQIAPQQQATEAARPAAPINALQFFDDETAEQKAWTGVVDNVMEAGSVATDIYAKLGEAEHQNQADKFTLDYNQRIMKLRDDINTKNVTSKTHDLNDLKGLTAFYQEEESKIFNDLSKTYNPQNYKRRDSLMKNRKSGSFLNAMSSIRQQRIKDITQNSADAFKIYIEGKTGQLNELAYDYEMFRYGEGRSNKKYNMVNGKKVLNPNFKADTEKYIKQRKQYQNEKNTIVEEIKNEATKRYHAGIISEVDKNNIIENIEGNVETTLAYRLATNQHETFLYLHEEKKDEVFGRVDPKTYAQYLASANSKKRATDKKFKKDLSDEDQAKFIHEYNKSLYTNDAEGIKKLIVKLNKKENYKNWTDKKSRANAETTLTKALKTIENREGKEVIGVEGLTLEMRSYEESVYDGNNNTPMPLPPSAKYNFKAIFKNDEVKLNNAVAEDKMLQNTLPIFRQLRMGAISQTEAKNQMFEMKPPTNTNTYAVEIQTWNRVNNRLKAYDKNKHENTVAVIRKELNNEENPSLASVQSRDDAKTALMNDRFDVQKNVEHQMVYRGMKNSGTIMNDPNQQILSPLKVVSKQDAYLFGRLVNDATAPTDILEVNEIIKDRYGKFATLAKSNLLQMGILKDWHLYSDRLSATGFQAHLEGDRNQIKINQYLSPTSVTRERVSTAFQERFGSGIETYALRERVKQHYMRYHAYRMSMEPEVDPKETADMFFSGLVLAEMPNHLPSHLQKHVWIGEEELQGTSIENFEKGALSMLMKFRDESGELDGELFVLGAKQVDPALLMKMTPEEIEMYPQMTKQIKMYQNQLMTSASTSVSPKEKPTLTLVRNPDSETFALALKGYPFGGIVRVGEKDAGGNYRAVTFTLDQILEHANRYDKRSQLLNIEGTPGLIPSPLDFLPEESSVNDMLEYLDGWSGSDPNRKRSVELLRERVSEDQNNEYTGKKAKNYLKSLTKELRENAPEMHEKGFFESLYDFGVETYYEYIDPNWGLRK